MHYLHIYFLQAAGENAPSPIMNFVLIGVMILVFWLFMIRPQAKKAKDQKKFITQIEKGDKIVTLSGIHGVVFKLDDESTTFVLETSSNNHIKMERSAISLELTKANYPKQGDKAVEKK